MHARGKACRSGSTPLSGSWRVLAVPGSYAVWRSSEAYQAPKHMV